MSPDLQKFLYKRQREILNSLGQLLPAIQLDPVSFFELLDGSDGVGFKDGGCSSLLKIALPGPEEASAEAHLHIEERYATLDERKLVFYRYEVCWSSDAVLSPPSSGHDYLRESILTWRRGVRFDHHPKASDSHHPTYHWHPNGCSEFRLATGGMSPLKVALIAVKMFERSRKFESETSEELKAAIEELKKEKHSLWTS